MTQRYDFVPFAATRKTDEGFLHDTPIVGRIGIQEYRNADGTTRRELRLPEEVFKADSLATFAGKPITIDHPKDGRVTSANANTVMVGTMLSAGKQDGDVVRAEIVLHQPEKIGERRQLSLGYGVQLDETPGEWQGQKYDAIQRNITVNHLSVVAAGRAGVARLNIDGNETPFLPEQSTMPKIKLDTGIEYEAPAEVVAAVEFMRGDIARLKTDAAKVPALEAERDGLKAKVDGIPAIVAGATEQGRKDAAARGAIDKTAALFKVKTDGLSDRAVKEAVIMAHNKAAVLTGKSDAYVDGAFDLAVAANADAAMAAQRAAGAGGAGAAAANTDAAATNADGTPKLSAYEQYMDDLQSGKVAAGPVKATA